MITSSAVISKHKSGCSEQNSANCSCVIGADVNVAERNASSITIAIALF
jgi:hypothetical protein